MPFVVVILDALGAVLAPLVAIIASMGTLRVLLFSWRLIRMIRAERRN